MNSTKAFKGSTVERVPLLTKSRKLSFVLFFIALATVGAVLFASKLMLLLGVTSVFLRYPISIVFGYGAFFGIIAIWLFVVRYRRRKRDDSTIADMLDLPVPSGSSSKDATFQGGGGRFGGGGASGSFDATVAAESPVASEAFVSEGSAAIGEVATAAGEGASSGAFDLVAAADEVFPVAVIAILVMALLVALGGGLGTLIAGLETTLAEALFASIVPAGLLHRIKGVRKEHWARNLLAATWFSLFVLLVISLVLGMIVKAMNPEAVRLMDIFHSR